MGTLSAPFNVGGAEHKRVGGAEHEHVGGAEQIAGAEHVGGAEHFDAAAASSGRLKRPPAPSLPQSQQQSEQQSEQQSGACPRGFLGPW